MFALPLPPWVATKGLSTGAGASRLAGQTTRAVVVFIFLVILVDLVFTTLSFCK